MSDLVKRARRLDTCIFPTERSKCLCGELADHIQKLEEQAHYASGVADLAMKHRDYAEQRVEKLEAALIDILKVPRSEASWGIALVIARHALEGKDD